MTNNIRCNFQAHPFHLVLPSPWPIFTCISLLTLTSSTVLTMHSFSYIKFCFFLSFVSLIYCMSFWFRDVIAEGTNNNNDHRNIESSNKNLNITKAISTEEITNNLKNDSENTINLSDEELGFYIAGLLEGDGHISLPFTGNTILNRILNPRIIFTSHINNIKLYAHIQKKLKQIGRFQSSSNNNVMRYIIGDKQGIIFLIKLMHGKLRTPKNESFNKLIFFMNKKYNLTIPKSPIDRSSLQSNNWFAGFTEADGYFGIKIIEKKSKSETRKRSVSYNISLNFRLDQRAFDKSSCLSMLDIMEEISKFLSCKLSKYSSKKDNKQYFSLSVSSFEKLKVIINYFGLYPLFGIKNKDFKDWVKVYNMFLIKQHLTENGRCEIKKIQSGMNSKRPYNNLLQSSIYLELFILSILLIWIFDFIYDL